MPKTKLIALYRTVAALVVFTAIVTQLVHGAREQDFSIVNFLSFFTILSNLFGAVVLLGFAHRGYLRGAATLYMVVTGIIYSLLLAHADVQTPLPWVNATLHYVFPVVMLADWLAVSSSYKLAYKTAVWWLAFPLAYFAYSLVRGPFAHWYPYPFLNVGKLGYAAVLVNALFVAIAFVLLTLVLVYVSNRRAQKAV